MGIANQAEQQIIIGKQAAKGTLATTGVGKRYNYTTETTGSLEREVFESNTIRPDQQKKNPRHGKKEAPFTLAQELQPGGHTEPLAGAMRAAWVSGATTGSISLAIDAAAKTITRTTGSFITDGIKVGDIVRALGFSNALNNGKNIRLVTVTALVVTYAADPSTLTFVTIAAAAGVTLTVPGKKLSLASANHTKDYFTIEDWQSDVPSSRRFKDCRVVSVAIAVPPNGHATISIGFIGLDADPQAVVYFVAPTAAATTDFLAGPNGILRYNDADSAVLSDFNVNMANGGETKSVVGTTLSPDVFIGTTVVTGSLSALFDSTLNLTNFASGVQGPLYLYLFEDDTTDSDFIIIKLPYVKLSNATTENDGTARTVASDFTAGVREDGSTTIEQTSIVIMDSAAV